MYERQLDFPNEYEIIFQYQFGFRKNHSTLTPNTING